ncbi:MAG: hypothetical protein MJA82_12245 [Clostridia bacterium]|nr:hypothetical protein [Clostridia bacterium]
MDSIFNGFLRGVTILNAIKMLTELIVNVAIVFVAYKTIKVLNIYLKNNS